MAEIVVFLGPTISAVEASLYLDALYLPPVGQGDVVRAVLEHAPSAIVIIDGIFAQRPAVRHKEILWAMARGVQVHGASSMGAIRAAELMNHGMIGHGLIYRWYRRMALADDGEVAVAISPPELGSHAISEALIDIRLTLKKAEREGIIGRDLRVLLEKAAASLHFPERTYRKILAHCAAEMAGDEGILRFHAWLKDNAVKQKKDDAIKLLTYLSAVKSIDRTSVSDIKFELTEAFAFDLKYSNLLGEIFPDALF